LEGNFRVDGSSKFLEGNQYGFFPSVAVGWRFTEEKFISDFTDRFLSSGKLRVSYGSLGNNFGVGRYEQQSTLSSTPYIIQNLVQRGFVNAKLINEMLSWEETAVFNIGLELGFLNNRLTAEIDWYDRLTKGMIRPSDLSLLISGAYTPAPRKNLGEMRNRGIEMTLAWKDRAGDFNYGISINGSYNATSLEQWNEYIGPGSTTADANNNAYNIFIGMPYNFTYGYEDIGIAQTWQDIYNATPQGAAPGDVLRKDINGDGRIDAGDRIPVNYTGQRDRPSTFGAINAYVSWKGFDIAILFQGATGRKDYWLNAFNNPNFGAQRYASTWDHWNNTWNYENRQAEWPRLGGSGNNTQPTSIWLEDMSYARMKNLQLGYSVPIKWLRKVHATSLRIAGSAENLFTLTNYRGLDPEKTGSGYNNNLYPINKSYALSIQLGF
jgi:TonB-linked SusC/RagA family outer membrane protein